MSPMENGGQALCYGLWLRAVCAILGMGPVGREALAPLLAEAYAEGATPIAAALGVRAWLAKRDGAERN